MKIMITFKVSCLTTELRFLKSAKKALVWTPSTLKLDSLRTRGGSLSLVGIVVMSSKPNRTITTGRTSCVMIAFLSRLEFRNLFRNIALYCCHFKLRPVCNPSKNETQKQTKHTSHFRLKATKICQLPLLQTPSGPPISILNRESMYMAGIYFSQASLIFTLYFCSGFNCCPLNYYCLGVCNSKLS